MSDTLQEKTNDLVRLLETGNSILFTGSGFSKNAVNIAGYEPPSATELSKKIADIIGINEDADDLYYTSDLCISRGYSKELMRTLRDNFIIKDISSAHEIIAKQPYRRIYTTNYDNSLELAGRASGVDIQPISLEDRPSDYLNNKVCVHLNGYIDSCSENEIQNKIRLTDSSYLSPDYFMNSEWRRIFLRDLDSCSAIVFVGYSLYDIEIRTILHNTPHLVNKTYFITWAGATDKEMYRLSQYGTVLKVGIDGLSEVISKIDVSTKINESNKPKCFKKIEASQEPVRLKELHTHNLLMFGHIEDSMIDSALNENFSVPFLINRSLLNKSFEILKDKNNILIHSDLGNGKSIFTKVLGKQLARSGFDCWTLDNEDYNPSKDLDFFIGHEGKIFYLIIDNARRHQEFINDYLASKPKNVFLIISDRTPYVSKIFANFLSSDCEIRDVSIDLLDSGERVQLIKIIDDSNLWSEFATLSLERKDNKIKEIYSNQLSGVLVGLLKSPEIKRRLQSLIEDINSNQNFKSTLFAICFCDIFGVEKTNSNINDICNNESIYKPQFRKKESFEMIYKINGSKIEANSAVLSLFLINNFFSDSYIVEFCLDLAERLNKYKDEERLYKEIFSKLLRFNQIEKLIPQKQQALDDYYMEIKRRCTWLTRHPHYWVQYAMCKLSFNKLSEAQSHLDTAYMWANKKSGYHTENIDTQQARLYILQSLREKLNSRDCFELFEKAHSLLMSLDEDGYMFRQVLAYKEIYQSAFRRFSKANKVKFEHYCSEMLIKAQNTYGRLTNELEHIRRDEFVRKGLIVLEEIVSDIKSGRSAPSP